MDPNALPKGATPLPDRFNKEVQDQGDLGSSTAFAVASSVSLGHITKDKFDPTIFAYYDTKIAHLEKLVGQLYFPHNPHV